MPEKFEIVVARYREDVSWLAAMDAPVRVYDKSGESLTLPISGHPHYVSVHPLPNIGRETHTYLHHIVHHWDELAGHTLFTQGAPFEHLAPGTGPRELAEMIAPLIERKIPFKGLAYFTLKCDHLGRPHDMFNESHRGVWAGWGRDIPLGRIYAELFQGTVPERYHVRATAGIFLASRDRIRSRPLSFYRHALSLVEADPMDADNTGHAFERLWYLIFNGNPRITRDSYPGG